MDAAVGLGRAYLEMSGFFVLTGFPVRVRDHVDITQISIDERVAT